jgi:transposase
VGQNSDREVTKPFSLPYKQKMIERLTGSSAESARRVARETGISQETLSRWLRQARNLPDMATKRPASKGWSVEEKVRVLSEAAKLSGPQLTAMLQREGLLLAEFEQWRLALGEDKASVAATKRIRKLERELARKEKALAEAAALLVLKKKVGHLWEDEGDDTDDENAK